MANWTKESFMNALSGLARPKLKNFFKENGILENSCARRIFESYRSGELDAAAVLSRLGETPGLILMALSEGYNIQIVARILNVTVKDARLMVLNACSKVKMHGDLPKTAISSADN